MDELAKSPVMQSIVISAVESAYVEPSGLSAEEKQAAHLTLQRVLRGVFEQKIKEGDLTRPCRTFRPRRQAASRS